jgi:hypothetical protein
MDNVQKHNIYTIPHMFLKWVVCDFEYLVAHDIHLLQMQVCAAANSNSLLQIYAHCTDVA